MKVQIISKNTRILALLALLTLTIVGLFVYQNMRQASPSNQTDAQKFSNEYTSVPADNRFTYATNEKIAQLFTEGTGVVFLGFPECPWCQHLAPLLNVAAQSEDIRAIYYLNIRNERANNTELYRQLVSYLSPYLPKDEDGKPRISVPDVTFLKNGKIVHRFKQENTPSGESLTPDSYWTNERQERAIATLREYMKSIRDE